MRDYREEGRVTTPFDMAIANDLGRFHVGVDVVEQVPALAAHAAAAKQWLRDKLAERERTIVATGQDMAEVRDWRRGASGRCGSAP